MFSDDDIARAFLIEQLPRFRLPLGAEIFAASNVAGFGVFNPDDRIKPVRDGSRGPQKPRTTPEAKAWARRSARIERDKRRREFRLNGKCVDCGGQVAAGSKSSCERHLIARRIASRKLWAKKLSGA